MTKVHQLLILTYTVLFSLLGIGLVAVSAYYLTSPVHITDAEFMAQFTPPRIDFYFVQPQKDMAFVAGCLSGPLFLFCTGHLLRRFVGRVPSAWQLWLKDAAFACSGLFFYWTLTSAISSSATPYPPIPPSYCFLCLKHLGDIGDPIWKLVCLGIALMVGTALWRAPGSRSYFTWTFFLLVAIWALLVPVNFYAPSQLNDDATISFHFGLILDALSQSCNGRFYLIDFTHAYGGYMQLLGPLLALLPRRTEVVLVVFGVLRALPLLFLLATAHQIIRRPIWLFLTGAALFGFEQLLTENDCYYQYSVVRLLFPTAALFLAACYFRRPIHVTYGFVTGLVALASVWNLDTGLVLWLSWTGALCVRAFFRRGIIAALRNLVLQLAAGTTVWCLFFLYLRIASGHWPDPAGVFKLQKFYAGEGYYCLEMLTPDTWMLVLTVYLVGLVVAFNFYLQKTATWKTDFTLMLSLLGIGIFDYFIGRSAEVNLIWVCYPMILLIGLLLDQTASLLLLQRLPRFTWVILLPITIVFLWFITMGVLGMPHLLSLSHASQRRWTLPSTSPVQVSADFVRSHTVPHERILLLSRQSGFCYYLSDTLNVLELPGLGELFFRSDFDALIGAIRERKIPKLFVDQDFAIEPRIYRPELLAAVRAAIKENYQSSVTSSTGSMTLYLPR